MSSSVCTLIMKELALARKIIDFIDDWVLRLATLGSLFLTSILMLTAETRRQNRYRWFMAILWAVYQVQPKVAEYAITHLSISISSSSTSTSAQEQQLVSFWAPFLLLHLAGPDNIAAFTLEDGKLSLRKVISALGKIIQGLYVMFKYIYICNNGVLRSAASIMFTLSAVRYLEKVITQLRGNFDNLWGSGDDSKQRKPSNGECRDHLIMISGQLRCGDAGDEELMTLLYAHTQFRACGHRAMSDSSVERDSPNYKTSQKIFISLKPEDDELLMKVAGMEASFMYDVLYTKVTVVHTWGGYLLRLVSPVCTAAASLLFWLYPKDGEETVDVVITYILLAATFFLDVVWLLSALASPWAHAFLNAKANKRLHHALLCSGRWRKLHHIIVSLDPWCWLLGKDASSLRMWSGRIGRYNLLAECTRRPSKVERLLTWLASQLSLDDIWKEFIQYWRCISDLREKEKKDLLKRIHQRLSGSGSYSMEDITTLWGQEAVKRRTKGDKLKSIKLELFFGREFQEDVLLWHIGTTIFLAHSSNQQDGNQETVQVIEALSEYLMFLVAVRPRMLPGLELRKLFEVTSKALKDSWVGREVEKCVPCSTSRKAKKLAEVMRKEMSGYNQQDSVDDSRRLIWVGNQLATELLKAKEHKKELLELMFDVWVDKMLYAATRCSKDSHAKQLGRGGELTTILWILAEHAGPFQIGETRPKDPPTGGNNNNSNNLCDCPCGKFKQEKKKICCQDPVEPEVCPNISCVQDYCCMDDYYNYCS